MPATCLRAAPAHVAAAAAIALVLSAGRASAQTYGFATLPPGSLNHTTASAISKVMKEKAGMNVLVQPTAGDKVIIPMVGRGEAEIGIANIMEAQDGFEGGAEGPADHQRGARAAHAVLRPQGLRMHTIADLKGKRVTMGYSAMRNIDVRHPRHAGHRRPDRKPTSSRSWCRTWCAAPTTSWPATPICSSSPSAARRCARPTPPSAASACWKWTRTAWPRRARSCPGAT